MSGTRTIRAKRAPDGTVVELLDDGTMRPLVDTTDHARLAAMTDDEIEANALADEDNPPLSEQELARLRRVPDPKRIRQRLHLTQEQFADRFEVPLGTLRDWERGARTPDAAARTLLRVIEHNPDSVVKALAASYAGFAATVPNGSGQAHVSAKGTTG